MEKSASKLQKICRRVFLATLFLLPLKFGAMLLPGVPNALPADCMAAAVNPLPPSLFPVWSALLLILTLAAYVFPAALSWKNPSGRLFLLFMMLPVAALIGFIKPDNLENAVAELEYLLGVSCFAAVSAIILNSEQNTFRCRVMNFIAAGTLCTAIAGAYQYFYGFDELKKFIAEQEKLHNIEFPAELKARAFDVRTYATFTFASALAGFLALAGVLTSVRAFRWGSRFEPVKLSQRLFALLSIILVAGIFLTTKGRSAFLAVIIASAVSGFLLLKSRKIKLLIASAAAVAIVLGACYIHYAGRGFGSMTERVGYLQSSAKMVLQHPFCGAGWGSFTYFHAQNKNFGNEELAKDPHNIIAAFASQTGIAGGLLVTLLIFYTLYLAAKRLKNKSSPENLAIFFGLSAFSLHMLMDLDWQVPALMACYTVFALLGCPASLNEKMPKKQLPVGILLITSIITFFGGIHWSAADDSFNKLLSASGQEAGVFSHPKSSYEVDAFAEKALKLAPYSHNIYNAWAMDKLRRGDLPEAEKLFKKVLELAPQSHAAHKSLSKVYKLIGNKELAEKHALEADRLFPIYKKIRESSKNE